MIRKRGRMHRGAIVFGSAAGSIAELAQLAAPLLKSAGLMIAMKGPKGRGEAERYPLFEAAEIIEYHLPGGARHHELEHGAKARS